MNLTKTKHFHGRHQELTTGDSIMNDIQSSDFHLFAFTSWSQIRYKIEDLVENTWI